MANRREYLGRKVVTIELHKAYGGGVSGIVVNAPPIWGAKDEQIHSFFGKTATYYVVIVHGTCGRGYAAKWVNAYISGDADLEHINLRTYSR